MYMGNLSDIYLSREEYKYLKSSNIKNIKYSELADDLVNRDLLKFCEYKRDDGGYVIPIKNKCEITQKGKAYLHYYKSSFIESRIPIIISALALIISLIVPVLTA